MLPDAALPVTAYLMTLLDAYYQLFTAPSISTFTMLPAVTSPSREAGGLREC